MSSEPMHDPHMPPLQFKGEIMDFDLGLEMDHRKRRRNRTTQSCLNCHTSKRKCDRKRPCQRCIQLGLTGLCVYEVDDPALRDDPNIDENTRLRNRIAELESLVRELRGKPHPRWAEPNFCDGDANEKWHSRSSRRVQTQFQRQKRDFHEEGQALNGTHQTSIVKVEQTAEASHQPLYRLSPSPGPTSMSYDASMLPPSSHENHGHHHQQPLHGAHGECNSTDDSLCYSPSSSSASSLGYGQHVQHRPSTLAMPNTDLYYHQPYIRPSDAAPAATSCTCLTNPAAGHPLIALTHQLQDTLSLLRQLPEHSNRHQCLILRHIAELNDLMHGGRSQGLHNPQYESTLRTHAESELLSPVSSSSHSSVGNPMHQDWSNLPTTSTAHFDTYFPVNAGNHGIYQKNYHIN